MRKHNREKRIRETGLFTSCPHETTVGEILFTQYVALYSVKPLGMNVTYISLNFYSKIPPQCPSYKSKNITVSFR